MRMVRRSLSGGLSDVSAYGFAGYGLVLSGLFGRHTQARAFGEVAAKLNERFDNRWLQPKVDLINGIFIQPWTDRFEACEEILARGSALSTENADFAHAAYNATSLACVMYYRGAPLERVTHKAAAMKMYARQARDHDMTAVLEVVERASMCLRGETAGPTDLSTFPTLPTHSPRAWSEQAFLASLSADTTPVAVFFYRAIKAGVLYLHGRPDLACALGHEAARLTRNAFSNPSLAEHVFYHAMSLARTAGAASSWPSAARSTLRGAVRSFGRWAAFCPENFAPRLHLLQAEERRLGGHRDVLHYLNAARETARRHGRIQYEALAAELAAEHCFRVGHDAAGSASLDAAVDAYQRWGALTKAKMLAEAPRRVSSRPPQATREGSSGSSR